MNNNLHDIDKLFRDGIDDHRESLPPAVWDGINQTLDKQQAAYFMRKYYKLRRWLFLLVLLGATGGGHFLIDKLKHNSATTEVSNKNTTALRKDKAVRDEALSPEDAKEISASTVNENNNNELNKILSAGNSIANEESTSTKKIKTEDKTNDRLNTVLTFPVGIVTTNNKQNSIGRNETPGQPDRGIVLAGIEEMKNKSIVSNQMDNFSMNKHLEAAIVSTRDYSMLFEPKTPQLAARRNAIITQTQANKKTIAASHILSLNAFAAPNFSFDRMEDDHHLAGPGQNRRDFHERENDDVSFSSGILFNYSLNKKISLESGLIYTFSSTDIGAKKIFAKSDAAGHTRYELPCSSGYSYISPKGVSQPTVGDSATLTGGKSTLAYLSVPLAASYSIEMGKFNLRPSLGFGINFLLSGKTQASVIQTAGTESSTNSISGLKSTYIDGRLGFGAEYQLNNKISISLRPTARIAVTPINQQTPVRSYQNYLSVETGIRVKL